MSINFVWSITIIMHALMQRSPTAASKQLITETVRRETKQPDRHARILNRGAARYLPRSSPCAKLMLFHVWRHLCFIPSVLAIWLMIDWLEKACIKNNVIMQSTPNVSVFGILVLNIEFLIKNYHSGACLHITGMWCKKLRKSTHTWYFITFLYLARFLRKGVKTAI